MVVVDFRIAAEIVDVNLALILLTNDAACRIETADAAVAHFLRAVLILLDVADLGVLPCAAVLEDEIARAGCQFPLMERPRIQIGGKESLEDGILRRQTDISGGGTCLHLDVALDLHIAILVHGNDIAIAPHLGIDVRRTGRIYIKRRLTLRDGRCFDIHHAVDMKTCRVIIIFHVDALVFRLNLDGMRRIACILDVEIGMLYEVNPMIFRLDGKSTQLLHLQRADSDEKSHRLRACPTIVRTLILLARTG